MKKSLILVFMCLIFTGCATVPTIPRTKGLGSLCGFLIDENNIPVNEAVVGCCKKGGLWEYVLTNQSGMFVFDDKSFGEYDISVEKEFFVKYLKKDLIFCENTKIFCIQIEKIDSALDKVEERIICEDYEVANNILNSIIVGRKKPAAKLIEEYKKIIKFKKKEKRISDCD